MAEFKKKAQIRICTTTVLYAIDAELLELLRCSKQSTPYGPIKKRGKGKTKKPWEN